MVRLLSSSDIEAAVAMDDVIPAVERIFGEYSEGKVIMPPKMYLDIPGSGDFRAMPAYVPSLNTAGLKWVNVHPGNREHRLPTVMATVLINDPQTGRIISIMDGTYLTDLRTGAAGGIAAKHLARDVSTVGLIGSGRQAWAQILAYRSIFKDRIRHVKIYSRRIEHSEALAARIQKYMGYDATACQTPEEAVDARLVATTTPARSPIIRDEWIMPGTHINAIGADAPGKQELHTELTLKARVFVDSVEQASHSGEINVPWSQGLINEEKLAGTIGEVITGRKPGRTVDEITVFDSTGLSIQDMAVAHMVYERALKAGRGLEFEF
ncbi:ornithine cyclodeaminase family protein [Methanocella arvoryzae]|uniref:Alanine dehydrogenase n=1 Tax=Methanocella arvoryzae (strain DSM 22066 / NBRC 105507 / MRE50) TaxID=351160 RepID=Q0W456_METAR|nr:alanine dehydrogenase [Methanocella arvoryzae]CAJ36837.1 ornithine cyclodeaminase [Methanocella arvoryzae MRE50]